MLFRSSVRGNAGLSKGIYKGRFIGVRRTFPEGRSKVEYDEESASFVYGNESDRRP